MKKGCSIIAAVAAILLTAAGCAGEAGKAKPQHADFNIKEVTEEVMTYAAREPERALDAIDSLRREGMPDYQADLLRVRVFNQGLEGTMLDSAITIGERLANLEVAQNNLAYREDLLETLVNACRQKHDFERAIKWGSELTALCRGEGEETEALRNEAELGLYITHMGRQQQGLAKIDSVLAALRGVRKFNELDAWTIAAKRKVTVLKEAGQTEQVIPVARDIIDRLTDYEQHPDDFRDGTYREPSDEDRQGYIDFYRAQAYGYLAEAYARGGNDRQARAFLEKYEQSYYGQTLDGRKLIVPTWVMLGENRKMEAIYEDLTTARFREYEQKMEIESQKEKAKHARQVALGLVLLVVLLMSVIGQLIFYQRAITKKNKVLAREIAEATEYKEKSLQLKGKGMHVLPDTSDLSSLDDAGLFQFFREAILGEKLFLNPALDRQQLMDTYHVSKDRIGAAFKQGSEFESLIDFLNNCRLDYSTKLLATRPDMTIGEVAAASGFASLKTFGRNFKRRFTLTPTEYREQRQQP
ncbi:MAG: AraC family transcriptional regulator [Bacteroidales bacterium]|nr:AraC family transcriptional regulator [Bacteroidales bacterium]